MSIKFLTLLILILFTSVSCSPVAKDNHEESMSNRFDYITHNGFLVGQPGTVAIYDEGLILREPFRQIYFVDIPKKKVVGGREFHYEDPRYVFEDPTGKWEINERPRGIFTYRYNGWKAFRINFYKDTSFIRTIDLKKSNPYSRKYYPSITSDEPWYRDEEDNYPQIQKSSDKKISEVATKAYTHFDVWESDESYVIIDYAFFGYDHDENFLGEEHTLVLMNNRGIDLGRIENIQGQVYDPKMMNNNKYIAYILKMSESKKGDVIIVDLTSKSEVFNSSKISYLNQFSALTTLSKNANSIAPYLNVDSCYLLLWGQSECRGTNPYYLDIETRMIYPTCDSAEAWRKYPLPKGFYILFEENKHKGVKF